MQVQQTIKYNVIGKFLNHLLVFINNILITRILGAEVSGYFFNELYVISFVVFIGSFGFDYSLVYLLSKDTVDIKKLNKQLFFVIIVFPIAIFLFCKIEFLSLRQPLIAVLLLSTGNLVLIIFQAILSAYNKFIMQNLVLLITNLALLIYLFIVYQPFDKIDSDIYAFETIAIALGVVYILQGLCFYICSRYGIHSAGTARISWKKLLSTGLSMMISSLIFFAYLRIDNFFVEKYCDPVILSNYVQCGKLGQYFLYLPAIVGSTLLPYYIKNNHHLSFAHWKKMIKPYLYILFIGAIILIVSGNYVFPLLFGKKFDEMYPILMIFLPGFFCLGILTLVNAVYFSKGNLKTIIAGDLLGLALIILLDYIFVPRYGVYAAAAISCFSYIVTLLFLLYHLQKQFVISE